MLKINKQRPDPFWLWVVLLMASGSIGYASELKWEHTEMRLVAREGDEKVEAIYPVKNGGSQIINVKSIETGCGCTSAQLANQHLLPGAKGELKVTFKLEGRMGSQSKVITIKTDEAANEPTLLWLRVDIVSPVVVLPRMLFWRVGDASEPKRVDVTLVPGEDVKLGEATCDTTDFTVTWDKAKSPTEARLVIKPSATTKPLQGQIRLAVSVGGVQRAITLYAYVK